MNIAVLWVSGRTALLAALFSLGTAHAMFRGAPIAPGVFALLAMLSKEEAIALPVLFTAYLLATERRLRAVVHTVPPAGHVVLMDAPDERFNLNAAFGALFPDAVQLYVGERWTGEIVADTARAQRGDLVYRFSEGRLSRVR